MAGQLIFQPPTFHWPSEDQQTAFEEWQSHTRGEEEEETDGLAAHPEDVRTKTNVNNPG